MMIKHVFVGIGHGVDEILTERWYFRYHCKEVVRFCGPWLKRYESFKAYPPPPEARALGVVGGRMTELWYSNVEDFTEAKAGYRPYTFEPWLLEAVATDPFSVMPGITIVPAMPTDDFLGKEPSPEETTIFRWFRLLKYPDEVHAEEVERWYLDVHSKEAGQQPGLLRYVSHRLLDNPPDGISTDSPWHRVEEMWYENYDAWRKAVIESPPDYTPPSWKKEPPFLESVSNFLRCKPDVDFLKDNPPIP
ncbi:MAG: hypothetical protein R6U50_15010 [Desulfobacterales bacterium]